MAPSGAKECSTPGQRQPRDGQLLMRHRHPELVCEIEDSAKGLLVRRAATTRAQAPTLMGRYDPVGAPRDAFLPQPLQHLARLVELRLIDFRVSVDQLLDLRASWVRTRIRHTVLSYAIRACRGLACLCSPGAGGSSRGSAARA